MPNTFSLLTMNCFGGLLWRVRQRLPSLLRELEEIAPDAVCLQEVQSPFALRTFTAAHSLFTASALQPGRLFPMGGLCTLSRHPIVKTAFIRYTTQGRALGPTIMDRMTRKGMLLTQFNVGEQSILVINTHTMANYTANWQIKSRAAQDQQRQLQQLADVVRQQTTDALVLVAGDFNIPRGGWLYEEFLERSGLTDPLAGDERPTYRPFPGVPAHYALPIDFIFWRAPAGVTLKSEGLLHFADTVEYIGGGMGYLSDHLGVQVTIEWDTA